MIGKYLADLEQRIDPATEEQLFDDWKRFVEGQHTTDIFSPRRRQCAPPSVEWPEIHINDALADVDCMALSQFRECSRMLAQGSGELLNVRCNYGTGIMPSVFGAELFIMPPETQTLPTTKPLAGGVDAMRALLERGVPELTNGLGGRVLAMGQRFCDLMQPYPRLRRYIHIYHPDTQGPMDICELLWGSGVFLSLLDAPDVVTALLELITETYIRFMQLWAARVPFAPDYNVHWAMLHKGTIMLRDDSAMNLSARMFQDFIAPYDQRLLTTFGGGAIHFCGKGDHYIHHIAAMSGVSTVNLSQPEYNDLERIFTYTIDRGIKLIGFSRQAAEQAINLGRNLHGNVHCWE
jgi:hypothetical protein